MGLITTLNYTLELSLCSSICVSSATRHIHMHIHMYSLLSLRRDSPPKSSPTFSVRPRGSVGRITVHYYIITLFESQIILAEHECCTNWGDCKSNLIRRSWVRFPPRSKDFLFTSCGSLIPFTRANAQWVIHGFN